ncbi:MAG: DUF1284 domain-containing protein [Thermaerobacter sp.]|nr:DUF1284 domain-containing protein [Thermaerobacter sp.]
MSPLTLRAHHLLCALGYRGLGYDAAFARRMASRVRLLRRGEVLVRLTDTVDEVCRRCPHRLGGECRHAPGSQERVRRRDRQVLDRLGVPPGAALTAREARRRVRERVGERELAAWCAECPWWERAWCRRGLAALRRDPCF